MRSNRRGDEGVAGSNSSADGDLVYVGSWRRHAADKGKPPQHRTWQGFGRPHGRAPPLQHSPRRPWTRAPPPRSPDAKWATISATTAAVSATVGEAASGCTDPDPVAVAVATHAVLTKKVDHCFAPAEAESRLPSISVVEQAIADVLARLPRQLKQLL